jgi:hypothetical protein
MNILLGGCGDRGASGSSSARSWAGSLPSRSGRLADDCPPPSFFTPAVEAEGATWS